MEGSNLLDSSDSISKDVNIMNYKEKANKTKETKRTRKRMSKLIFSSYNVDQLRTPHFYRFDNIF